MEHDSKYYDEKWKTAIRQMPKGGDYRFDLRQAGYDIVKNAIKDGSKVFDYACGLGIIDIQLAKEKNCIVSGCDWSKVATDYITSQIEGEFKNTDKFFGNGYDVIIAIYFLEHIKDPVSWLKDAMTRTNRVICALPNNFRKAGEHIDMAWGSWQEFNSLFREFDIEHLHLNNYSEKLHPAYRHPIIQFTKKGTDHACIDDSRATETGTDKETSTDETETKQKRVRRTKAEIQASRN